MLNPILRSALGVCRWPCVTQLSHELDTRRSSAAAAVRPERRMKPGLVVVVVVASALSLLPPPPPPPLLRKLSVFFDDDEEPGFESLQSLIVLVFAAERQRSVFGIQTLMPSQRGAAGDAADEEDALCC